MIWLSLVRHALVMALGQLLFLAALFAGLFGEISHTDSILGMVMGIAAMGCGIVSLIRITGRMLTL